MLLRQTLLYLPAQVLGPVAQFVSIILWTHYLSPAEMGVFALIGAAQEFGYIGTLFWFSLYTMRYFDKHAGDVERSQFYNTESAVLVGASAGTILGLLTLPLFVDAAWTRDLVGSALAYSVSRTLATHLTDRARTVSDTLTYSVLQIVWPVLGLLLGMLLVELHGPTASSVLWGYALAQTIALAYAGYRLKIGWSPWIVSREMIAVALRYGLPLVAGGLFIWLANNGIRFVVEAKEGAAAVGLVTVGWGLGLRAAAMAAMLVTAAAFPLAVAKARSHGIGEGQAQLIRNGILLLAILTPAAAGLWAISDPLVRWMVADPFRTMTAEVLPWAIIAGAARNMRIHFGEQVFLLREETQIPLINDAIDGLATIAGAAIGLAMYGLHGSVVGAAVASILSLGVTLACAAIWYDFAIPASHVTKIGAAALLMVGVLQFFPAKANLPSLTVAVIIGAAVYAVSLLALYPELTQTVLRRLGLRRTELE